MIRFLLEQAEKLRTLAQPHRTGISGELLDLARSLEGRAKTLEQNP
jgi:hypothetical protein